MNESDRNRLKTLRDALVSQHKALLDSERIAYEKTFGTLPTASEFLKVVLSDPWFAWLQPLSRLIVAVDEALDDRKNGPVVAVAPYFDETRQLLVASETGDSFSHHYFNALQRDPDVVLGHAGVKQALGGKRA
jgi:hypothetical protein